MTDMTAEENVVATLNSLAAACHRTAKEHGFWDNQEALTAGPLKIALMHSELSEALEAMRRTWPSQGRGAQSWFNSTVGAMQVTEEFADVLIRVLDYCGAAGMPIGQAVVKKMENNRERTHMHGKAF